jgi:hypothetical protein
MIPKGDKAAPIVVQQSFTFAPIGKDVEKIRQKQQNKLPSNQMLKASKNG